MREYKLKASKLETAIVGTYKKIEDTIVGSYKKIENAFVDAFLEKAEGNSDDKSFE